MPGMSRSHENKSTQPVETSTANPTAGSMGNSAAQQALATEGPGEMPGGVLSLCMASQAADADGCLAEGRTTGASMHGWIALEPEGSARESYGFWPAGDSELGRKTGGLAAVVAMPGEVKNPDPKDSKGPDVAQRFDVSGEQVADLRSWIAANADWTYSYGARNCVDWANQACSAAGQKPTIPDAPGPDPISCPSQSMKWIKGQNWRDGVPQEGEQVDPKLRGEAEFNHLTEFEKSNWLLLGYHAGNWETGNPLVEAKAWDELSEAERSGAGMVGYTQWTWDEE